MSFQSAFFDELEKIAKTMVMVRDNKLGYSASIENPRYGFFTGQPRPSREVPIELHKGTKMTPEELQRAADLARFNADSGLNMSHLKGYDNAGKPKILTTSYPVGLLRRIKRRLMSQEKRDLVLRSYDLLDSKAFPHVDRMILTSEEGPKAAKILNGLKDAGIVQDDRENRRKRK